LSTPPAPDPGWTLPRLRVGRDGEWSDDDVEITHAGILANLRSNLRRDAEGYFIQTRARIPVEVEDVPWIVTRVSREGERLHVVLNDGTEEDVDPGTLRLGAGDVPYCAVKSAPGADPGTAFEAKFNRAAAFQLLGMADYDEGTGRGTLRLGGREITLQR
jgi:Protein of unknown function (DUF1285)